MFLLRAFDSRYFLIFLWGNKWREGPLGARRKGKVSREEGRGKREGRDAVVSINKIMGSVK